MSIPSLFPFFFLIHILLMIINPSHSRELVIEDPKVNVSLYYETLCPGCQNFIVGVLGDLYEHEPDLMSIVNLHLVPYGNALILKNGTVKCQHGPDECYFNTIEACALSMWPSEKSFPFILCVEAAFQQEENDDDLTSTWKSCCDELGFDSDKLGNFCFESGHGDEVSSTYTLFKVGCIGPISKLSYPVLMQKNSTMQLIRRNANETESLNPPRTFVPWVTVNGSPLGFDFYNLKQYICDAYKDHEKIKACNVHVSTSLTEKKQKSTQAVCHANVQGLSP